MFKFILLAVLISFSFTMQAQQRAGIVTQQGKNDGAIDPASDILSSNIAPEPSTYQPFKLTSQPRNLVLVFEF